MKRIIAVLSLVLVLALSLTACSGKKDHKASTKNFEYGNLSITLTESFVPGKTNPSRDVFATDENGIVKDENGHNVVIGITYTSASGTGVTIEKISTVITAENDMANLEAMYAEDAKGTNNVKGKLTIHTHGETKDKIVTATNGARYYVFTLDADGGKYVYLKAFMKNGDYAYSITFSTTEDAYSKEEYNKHFITWLNSATITLPSTPADQ